MAECIDRDAVLRDWPLCDEPADAYQFIRGFPAADVAPVVHGRWKPYDLTYGRSIYYCTACERSAEVPTVLDKPIFNYCPNCGAKMDEQEE